MTLPSGNLRAGVVFSGYSSAPTRQRSLSTAEIRGHAHTDKQRAKVLLIYADVYLRNFRAYTHNGLRKSDRNTVTVMGMFAPNTNSALGAAVAGTMIPKIWFGGRR